MKKFLVILAVVILLAVAGFFFLFPKTYSLFGSAENSLHSAEHGAATANLPLSGISSSTHAAQAASGNVVSSAAGTIAADASALENFGATASAAVEGQVLGAKIAVVDALAGAVSAVQSALGVPAQPTNVVPAATSIPPSDVSVGAENAQSIAGPPDASGTVITPLVGSVVSEGSKIEFVVNGDLLQTYHASEALLAVDWGDGSQMAERVSATSSDNFLSHVYDATGTYRPIFAFTMGTTSLSYEFTVVVL